MVAVSETTTAVYVPTPKPSVMVIDDTGGTTANLPLPKPASPEAAATRPGDLITWWTGDAVMVFAASGMQYRYTVGPVDTHIPIGPATMMAGKLIIPVSDGVGVYDPKTGANERFIPLRRLPAGVGGGAQRRRLDRCSSSAAARSSRWVSSPAGRCA